MVGPRPGTASNFRTWSDGVAFTAPVPIFPGKATLISPSGGVSTSMPTYLWNADPNATWYFLWVDDTTGKQNPTVVSMGMTGAVPGERDSFW